jgi:predicted metal-dependent phosphoesterase TrpH
VVIAAGCVGLAAVAITDHDTLSAIAIARPEAARLGVELIAGVELTAVDDRGREIHILGHFVRDDDPALQAAARALRAARGARLQAMAGRLEALGLQVDLEALAGAFPRATLGRRHLAEWLVRTHQVENHRAVFARYLGDGGPAEVAKPRLPWTTAVALIRGAGGVAGLAHPPYDLRETALRGLAEGGLGAVEVAGPGVDNRRSGQLRARAERLGLVPIAGSDFHAPDRPGRWVGSTTTAGQDLERLRARARAQDQEGQRR